jgi:beta-phosphoglucomutase-like phosphatase (HAD superfamily)
MLRACFELTGRQDSVGETAAAGREAASASGSDRVRAHPAARVAGLRRRARPVVTGVRTVRGQALPLTATI